MGIDRRFSTIYCLAFWRKCLFTCSQCLVTMMIVFASFAKSVVDTDCGGEYLKHCLSGLEIYAKAKTVPNERDTPLFLSSLALSNYLPHNYIVHSIGSILSNLDLSAGDKLLSDCRIALAIVETFYSKSNENKHNSTY
jgi:hypothetical protein